MRVVALDAIHFAFDDGMMLREVEFGVSLEVAIKASGRVFAGVENEFAASAANGDVLAAGAVAGFATARAGLRVWRKVHPGVGAGGELLHVIGVAGVARLIADVMGAGNVGGHDDIPGHGGAGIEANQRDDHECRSQQGGGPAKPGELLLAGGRTHGCLSVRQAWRTAFVQWGELQLVIATLMTVSRRGRTRGPGQWRNFIRRRSAAQSGMMGGRSFMVVRELGGTFGSRGY